MQGKEIFQTIPEWAVKEAGEKGEIKPYDFDPKILIKILFHYPPIP